MLKLVYEIWYLMLEIQHTSDFNILFQSRVITLL